MVIDETTWHDWRSGAWVAPAPNFRMSVRERETTGVMMVIAWQVEEAVKRRFPLPTFHARGEVAHVNAVLAHVQKNKNFGRAGIVEFGLFHVDFVVAENGAPAAVSARPATQEDVHRDAPNAWFELARHHDARTIRRTFPDRQTLSAVGPHRALLDG